MGAYDYDGGGTGSMYLDFVDDAGTGYGDAIEFGPGAGDTAYTDQPTIFAVQAALKARGINPGPQDGKFGQLTEAALALFNTRRGVARRGPPDLDTLHALGLQPGGFAWGVTPQQAVGIAVAGSTGLTLPTSTPPRIPGTIPVTVPVAPRPSAVNAAAGPQLGGKGGKGGGVFDRVVGWFKGLSGPQLAAVGVVAALGAMQLGGGSLLGSSSAPRRRRAAPRRRRR